MPPKPLYEVKPEAYLFGPSVEKPEEKIRQWVLFELLSTYGVSINNIEIERKVKVGTRNHWADIVILRENVPYVVIECKRWENKKIAAGVDQAISYADANTMRAPYAVFTNGDVWIVKRKLMDQWVDVPDISKHIDDDHEIELEQLIRSIDEFKPIWYWQNQVVPKKEAKAYFSKLQEIFYSGVYPLDVFERDLLFATDNLLRSMSCADTGDTHYVNSKMAVACKGYAKYFEKLNREERIYQDFDNDTLREMIVTLQFRFSEIVRNGQGLACEEYFLMRFVSALFQYFLKIIKTKDGLCEYQDVPSVLNAEFQELTGLLFNMRLGVAFPDRLLEESCTYLRDFCEGDWERHREESMRK